MSLVLIYILQLYSGIIFYTGCDHNLLKILLKNRYAICYNIFNKAVVM
jgi:hypothetical protein